MFFLFLFLFLYLFFLFLFLIIMITVDILAKESDLLDSLVPQKNNFLEYGS